MTKRRPIKLVKTEGGYRIDFGDKPFSAFVYAYPDGLPQFMSRAQAETLAKAIARACEAAMPEDDEESAPAAPDRRR